MDDLDGRMQRVLDVTREGMSPRAGDTERMRRVLLAATAGVAVSAGTSSAAASTASSKGAGLLATLSNLSLGAKVGAAVAVSAVLGSAGLLAMHAPSPARGPASAIAVPAQMAVAPAPIVTDPPEPAAAAAVPEKAAAAVAARRPTPPATRSAAPDPLKAELALIDRARQALRSDNPRAGLAALDEHRARFKQGVLAQERNALRALALCSLGDPRGREQAQRFVEQNAGSPLSAHVRAGCK